MSGPPSVPALLDVPGLERLDGDLLRSTALRVLMDLPSRAVSQGRGPCTGGLRPGGVRAASAAQETLDRELR